MSQLGQVAAAVAVAAGAAAGALLRWQAGLRLGSWGGLLVGTLAVNVVGGALMGLALAWFRVHPEPEWLRLLAITGFLGGLTTFSAFSGESLNFLVNGRFGLALLHTALHVCGALGTAALAHALGRRLWGE